MTILRILLSALSVIRHLICGYSKLIRISNINWIWYTRHCGLGQQMTCWFHCWKNTTVLLIWKLMDLFIRKNHCLRCWGWPSHLNWNEAPTLSLLLKLPPRKLEPWFVLQIFFYHQIAHESTIQQCMDYCLGWCS